MRQFQTATSANNWSKDRYIQIAAGYLKGPAFDWFTDQQTNLTEWNNDNDKPASFTHGLIDYFSTPERKNKWFYELNSIKQKPREKVDTYIYRFKSLLLKVDSADQLPDIFKVRIFTNGLRKDLAKAVVMENETELKEVYEAARLAETGEYYENKDKDDELEKLTE